MAQQYNLLEIQKELDTLKRDLKRVQNKKTTCKNNIKKYKEKISEEEQKQATFLSQEADLKDRIRARKRVLKSQLEDSQPVDDSQAQ